VRGSAGEQLGAPLGGLSLGDETVSYGTVEADQPL
jgi:hypothetical protein